MNSIIVIVIIAAALFALPYFTKRRLGLLGLGLVAGALLSQLWVGDVTPIVASAGFILVKPPLESVIAAVITLLPALILLPSAQTYSSMVHRIVGSVTFALLAVVLLLVPLGSALVLEGPGRVAYDVLSANQAAIVSTCLTLSILDIVVAKSPKRRKD